MSMYNVREIAKLFDVSEETVRRWIRSRKLKAERSSRKEGNIVNEDELFKFVYDKPKYKKMIVAKIQQRNNPF